MNEKIRLFVISPIFGGIFITGMNMVNFHDLNQSTILYVFSFITGYLVVAMSNLFSLIFRRENEKINKKRA